MQRRQLFEPMTLSVSTHSFRVHVFQVVNPLGLRQNMVPVKSQTALRMQCRDETSRSQQIGRRPRVLLAASGSVATIKLAEIAAGLVRFADVRVLLTAAARHFVSEDALPPAVLPVYGARKHRRRLNREVDTVTTSVGFADRG